MLHVIHYIFFVNSCSICAQIFSRDYNDEKIKVWHEMLTLTTEGEVLMKTKMKVLLMSLCAAFIMLAGSGATVHAEDSVLIMPMMC